MAQRITVKHLRAKVDIINRALGYDVPGDEPTGWIREDGSVQLSQAYGGYAVHQRSGDRGGVRDLTGGHGTAREASEFLSGMIAALHIVKDS